MSYVLALAALLASNALWTRGFHTPFPDPTQVRVPPEEAAEAIVFMSLGMRRVAAELDYIRLLLYYGAPEAGLAENVLENGGGVYPELYERSRRLNAMDPSFSSAVLYSAGALAFNLDRPEEALALLDQARRSDPTQWRYQAYLAAIAYKKSKDPGRVADSLLPVASDPDSPALIKQVTAFLLKHLGRRAEAAKLYRLILDTSKDEGYRKNARKSLAELQP